MTNNLIKTIYSSIFDTIETNKGYGNFDKFTINHKLKESKKIDESIKLDPKFINNDNVNNKEKIKKTPIIIKKMYIEEENDENSIEFPESASQYIPLEKPKMEKSIIIGNNKETMNKNKGLMIQNPIQPINSKRNFINALLKKPIPKEVILNSDDSDKSKDYDTDEAEDIEQIENDQFNDIISDSKSLEYDTDYDKNKDYDKLDDLYPGKRMNHEKSSSSSSEDHSDSPSLNDKNINIEDLFANYKDNKKESNEPIKIDIIDDEDDYKDNKKEEDQDVIIIDNKENNINTKEKEEEEEIDLFKLPEKKINNPLLSSLLFNNFNELVDQIKDILDIDKHLIPFLKDHFGSNPIEETDDPNSKYLIGHLTNHINNLSAVFALLLRKTEINKILKNYQSIFINAPEIKYDLIDDKDKKYYKKIEKSIEVRKNFIDQQINNLQQQYTKQRSKKKQDLDIIFNLVNKHFGELISRTNFNFFIQKLLELTESIFDYNNFPLKSFIETSLDLDFAPSIITRKFTEEDKKCFNSIPICICSRKPIEIGEEVRVCRLIQIDKERSIDWHQGEKLPANPHKEEIFLKSLKCYYVKANDEIDLENDEKFELFKFDDNLELPSNNIQNKMDIDNNIQDNNNNDSINNNKKKKTIKKKVNEEEKKKVKKTNKKKQDLNQITKSKKNNNINISKGKKRKLNEIMNEKISNENKNIKNKKQKLNNKKSIDIDNNNNNQSLNEYDDDDDIDINKEYTIADLLKKTVNDDNNNIKDVNNNFEGKNNNIYTEEIHLNNLIVKLKPIDNFLIKFNEKYYVQISPLWIEINNCLQYYLKEYKEGKRKLEIDLKLLKDQTSIFHKFRLYIKNKKTEVKDFFHQVDDFTLGLLEYFSLFFIENKPDILKSYNKEYISECKDKILYEETGIAFNKKQILLDLIYTEAKKVDKTSYCHFKPYMDENLNLLHSIDEILFFKYHKFVLLDLFYYFFYNRK